MLTAVVAGAKITAAAAPLWPAAAAGRPARVVAARSTGCGDAAAALGLGAGLVCSWP